MTPTRDMMAANMLHVTLRLNIEQNHQHQRSLFSQIVVLIFDRARPLIHFQDQLVYQEHSIAAVMFGDCCGLLTIKVSSCS